MSSVRAKAVRLRCKLNLFHRWRTYPSPLGYGRYQRCLDCGKERDVPTVMPPM